MTNMSVTDKEFFCSAPWVSIYLNPDGRVSPCCVSTANLGNVKNQSIDDIIHGPSMIELRQHMLDNKPVDSCNACWRQEKKHRFQNMFNSIWTSSTTYPDLDESFYSGTNNFRMSYIDLRFNNTCNFACIYCGPFLSSMWQELAQTEATQFQIYDYQSSVAKPRGDTKKNLLDWVTTHLHTVDKIYMAGGEPLMIKENAILLERLHQINPLCNILLNTNLSQLENNRVFDLLKKMPNVTWMVSGEAIGHQWEYIRWPGNFDLFVNNLKIVKSLESIGHKLTFNAVGMNLNCIRIWDYIDMLRSNGFLTDEHDLNLGLYNMRDSRSPFALQRLPEELKSIVKDRIKQGEYKVNGLDNYIEALKDPGPDQFIKWHGLERTKNMLETLDMSRKLNSREIFPEIYQYLPS